MQNIVVPLNSTWLTSQNGTVFIQEQNSTDSKRWKRQRTFQQIFRFHAIFKQTLPTNKIPMLGKSSKNVCFWCIFKTRHLISKTQFLLSCNASKQSVISNQLWGKLQSIRYNVVEGPTVVCNFFQNWIAASNGASMI